MVYSCMQGQCSSDPWSSFVGQNVKMCYFSLVQDASLSLSLKSGYSLQQDAPQHRGT